MTYAGLPYLGSWLQCFITTTSTGAARISGDTENCSLYQTSQRKPAHGTCKLVMRLSPKTTCQNVYGGGHKRRLHKPISARRVHVEPHTHCDCCYTLRSLLMAPCSVMQSGCRRETLIRVW